MKLDKRKKYLQISFNNSLLEAQRIIQDLPISDRILIEAGTPLIMQYGMDALISLRRYLTGEPPTNYSYPNNLTTASLLKLLLLNSLDLESFQNKTSQTKKPNFSGKQFSSSGQYIMADIKCADLADKEIDIAYRAGANAITCLGLAPIETIDNFIQKCRQIGLDSAIDMINVENPLLVLQKLQNPPDIVILHRGVDEIKNSNKQIPYYQIKQIKGIYGILVAVAGVDNLANVEEAFFNNADIVVLWQKFYSYSGESINLVKRVLAKIS